MQDLVYLMLSAGFFALMAAFVVGCERIIGDGDDEAIPGGEPEAAIVDAANGTRDGLVR